MAAVFAGTLDGRTAVDLRGFGELARDPVFFFAVPAAGFGVRFGIVWSLGGDYGDSIQKPRSKRQCRREARSVVRR
jgi:hypothetical protein